ncbi:DHH family phosphoesterase [Reichenbachiella versicolor]|uniref:DHH family phosphoesterase n=1 Tax=Reichenbachiella versicolor TaxID=1821036 RepID=UPI000D6E5DE3|nr:DHH family phosphoesterase [Reichenbachiella versicolor]
MNKYQEVVAAILAAENIVITSHKSPDGDSVGSSLGLLYFIEKLGKNATICHPDVAPDFLYDFGTDGFLLMTDHQDQVRNKFEEADLLFSLDYNGTDRVGEEMQVLLETSTCKKIMIDHHLEPSSFADIMISETSASSTCQLIAELIIQSGNDEKLDQKVGTPIYLGILTDTGSFRFSSVEPRTHEILAKLLSAGVEHHLIHEAINDTNTESRIRLQGFALSEKMIVLDDYMAAIIPLSKEELESYEYKKGDTDNLANLALTIRGMKMAVMLSEKDGKVKMSFRSKGENNPVNTLAADHFDGGGHANAAGGISDLSLDETVEKLKQLIPNYFG